MEYQKIRNLIDYEVTQPFKLRTKHWVKINDDECETQKIYSQFKFKTTMLKSNFFDDSDGCILVKGTITITGEKNKQVIFINYEPFTNSHMTA